MFTKHLQGYDLEQTIDGIKQVGIDGADLCVRAGYPVNPDNCTAGLPAAAKRFADEGLAIAIVTAPGNFTDPTDPAAETLFAACGEAGVPAIKLGYWTWTPEGPGYRDLLDRCRAALGDYARLAEKHGVKACVHTHSGHTMGLNASAAMRPSSFGMRSIGFPSRQAPLTGGRSIGLGR